MNYYNEIDPYAAQWIRNLIAARLIPDGVVDDRSIEDVTPGDLAGFTQCHFFAGIAGWSLALSLVGYPSDRPIWTGSCPCQPFSTAGASKGFDDERHLWPAWEWLIQECQPAIVTGEQVASKAVDAWLDLVFDDLEGLGYACGAIAFPSASVRAPHIRDRTYWLAHAHDTRLEGWFQSERQRGIERLAGPRSVAVGLADTNGQRRTAITLPGLPDSQHHAQPRGGVIGLEIPDGIGRQMAVLVNECRPETPGVRQADVAGSRSAPDGASAIHTPWDSADWLYCRDERWRPVEPGTFPLAHGVSGRMGRCRAYGNAINPYQAAEFLKAALL